MIWGMAGEKKIELVSLGWKVPEPTKDRFIEFCTDVGVRYQDGCAGAMVAWEYLPANVQQQAIKAARGLAEPDAVIEALRIEGLAVQTAEAALRDTTGPQSNRANKPQAREASGPA